MFSLSMTSPLSSLSARTAVGALALGAFRYLVKPFPLLDLVGAVEEAARLHKMAKAKRAAIELLGDGVKLLGDRTSLSLAFERALGSLWMAFQPIVDFRRKTIFGYEALVRCREPALAHPGALFDAAERLGTVEPLGRTIRDLVPPTLAKASPEHLVFVNLHSRDLLDPTLYSPDSWRWLGWMRS